MKQTRRLAITAATGAMSSSAVLAHGGHPVPAGVPLDGHLHLAQTVIVPGSLGLALLLAAIAVGDWMWRRRTSARAGKTGRGDDRRNA